MVLFMLCDIMPRHMHHMTYHVMASYRMISHMYCICVVYQTHPIHKTISHITHTTAPYYVALHTFGMMPYGVTCLDNVYYVLRQYAMSRCDNMNRRLTRWG